MLRVSIYNSRIWSKYFFCAVHDEGCGLPCLWRPQFCTSFCLHWVHWRGYVDDPIVCLCVLTNGLYHITLSLTRLAEGARNALSLAGTMLGYYPVRVLPSKTAIAPVNPTFLPRVRNFLPVLFTYNTCPSTIFFENEPLIYCLPCNTSLRMKGRCAQELFIVQTLIKR